MRAIPRDGLIAGVARSYNRAAAEVLDATGPKGPN